MRHFITLVEALDPDLIERTADWFGITNNPLECGFLLPDGRLLDLSGRHYDNSYHRVGDRNVLRAPGRDYQANNRLVDHSDLDDLADDYLELMTATGIIRVAPKYGFSMMVEHRPTRQQIRAMTDLSKFYQDELWLETYTERGSVVNKVYTEIVTPRTIEELYSNPGPEA